MKQDALDGCYPTAPLLHTPYLDGLRLLLRGIPPEAAYSLPFPHSGYGRRILFRDESLELATACFPAGEGTPLHGHGESAAAFLVIEGEVSEERYLPEGDGYRYERVRLSRGAWSYLPPGGFHQVTGEKKARTVNAYLASPSDPIMEVPQEILPRLEEAKARALAGNAAKERKILSVCALVSDLADVWGEREAEADRKGQTRLPGATLEDIRQSGLLTAPIPIALGGWGSSLREVAEAVRLIARRAPSTALALAMPLGNAATTRIPDTAVPEAVRPLLGEGRRWLASQAGRGRILAVANSEPGAGGDLASTRTIARRDREGKYRLTGQKSFATFGPDADYFLCAARREVDGVVDGFFVARDAPGVFLDDRWDPLGMRPTASVGIRLEEAPAEAVLGYPGALSGVNARHWSTLLFTAVFIGIGEGALQAGVAGAPRGSAWARSTLAESALSLDAAAGFLQALCAEERWPYPPEDQARARRAKTFAARIALEVASRAAIVAGGRAYRPDHPVARFLRDAVAGPLLRPPTPQAMDEIIASFD